MPTSLSVHVPVPVPVPLVPAAPPRSPAQERLRNETLRILQASEAARHKQLLEARGWRPTARPGRYDCRGTARRSKAHELWQRVCAHSAVRHEPRWPSRMFGWAPEGDGATLSAPNASLLAQLLDGRVVYILGDSHALDLWCATTCYVLGAGDPSRHSVEAEPPGKGGSYFLVARGGGSARTASAFEVAFRVPTCATSRGGHCGAGTHCGTLGPGSCFPGCGMNYLGKLQREQRLQRQQGQQQGQQQRRRLLALDAAWDGDGDSLAEGTQENSTSPSFVARPMLVLLSPCPMYLNGDLSDAMSADSLSLGEFATMAHPLRSLCARRKGGQCRTFAASAEASYQSIATGAARALRVARDASCLWSARGPTPITSVPAGRAQPLPRTLPPSVVLLVSSPVSHFPIVRRPPGAPAFDAWSAERLDGAGSYDRLVGSALVWLHGLLRAARAGESKGDARAAGAGAGGLGVLAARLARAMQMTSASPTSFRGEKGFFEPSVALGISQRLAVLRETRTGAEAARATAPHSHFRDELNETLALLELLEPVEMLREMRASSCRPASERVTEAAHEDATAASRPWRQRIEAAAARAAGIPLLDSWAARADRWDLHPGVQGGAEASVARIANRFDCAHSSLAMGAFDGEMLSLQQALTAEREGVSAGCT